MLFKTCVSDTCGRRRRGAPDALFGMWECESVLIRSSAMSGTVSFGKEKKSGEPEKHCYERFATLTSTICFGTEHVKVLIGWRRAGWEEMTLNRSWCTSSNNSTVTKRVGIRTQSCPNKETIRVVEKFLRFMWNGRDDFVMVKLSFACLAPVDACWAAVAKRLTERETCGGQRQNLRAGKQGKTRTSNGVADWEHQSFRLVLGGRRGNIWIALEDDSLGGDSID